MKQLRDCRLRGTSAVNSDLKASVLIIGEIIPDDTALIKTALCDYPPLPLAHRMRAF
jgi:hypothetical protein